MEFEERGHRRLDLVTRTPARFPRHRRHNRHTRMGLEPVAMGRGRGARSGERETAITSAAERLLPVHAVAAEAKRPAARAARLDDEVKARATSVWVLGARRLWPNRLDEPVGHDSSHDCGLACGVNG